MARLDRLGGSAKELAQIAAAVGREFPHALLASVARQPETELKSALYRLIAAGLLFRRDDSPHATYLFKHALVQDAAYGTLLREPRRALHARIAEAIENEFAETAENRPELLARHCTEACLIEKAAGLWGKAGQRSLARSALVEAAEQLRAPSTRLQPRPARLCCGANRSSCRSHSSTLSCTSKAMRRPSPKRHIEQARQFIEAAEALGEHPEDPLLPFSVLYGVWAANYVAFNGRRDARACVAIRGARGEATADRTGHDRASPDG